MDHDKLGAIASTGFKSYAVDTTFVSLDAVRLLDVTDAVCVNYDLCRTPVNWDVFSIAMWTFK